MADAASAGRRVGLFGGTFDPVHRAHVALARTALRALKLDELRWIPAGQPWQKARPPAPAEHRVAMLRLATAGEPCFVVDTIEIDRGGASYTIDTVRALADGAAVPTRWFLVVGADQYAALHTWHDWRGLLPRVTLAVALRPGTTATPHADVAAAGHVALPLPPLDISSSEVRHRVGVGADTSELVPPDVRRYIETHRLYRAG